MKSLSLIQAIVLLHEKERLKNSTQDHKIDCLEATSKNLSMARELAHKTLGRNLGRLPTQTRMLFLLIEKWTENQCAARKIDHSAFRFTLETIRLDTGWRDARLKVHLNRLVALRYLQGHRDENKQEFQYTLLHSSKSVTTVSHIKA